MRYGTKWPEYAKQWDRMVIKSSRRLEFEQIARELRDNMKRYQTVEDRSGVPWWLIAAIHIRESDGDFSTYLGNGDPLNKKTTHVPKGRGPFKTWEDGAVDAFKYDGLTSVKDWRLEKALYYAEILNGTGYDHKGLPSPYLWGGTNIQKRGKYTSDGHWSSKTWDQQPGVAPMIWALSQISTNVQLVRET